MVPEQDFEHLCYVVILLELQFGQLSVCFD